MILLLAFANEAADFVIYLVAVSSDYVMRLLVGGDLMIMDVVRIMQAFGIFSIIGGLRDRLLNV